MRQADTVATTASTHRCPPRRRVGLCPVRSHGRRVAIQSPHRSVRASRDDRHDESGVRRMGHGIRRRRKAHHGLTRSLGASRHRAHDQRQELSHAQATEPRGPLVIPSSKARRGPYDERLGYSDLQDYLPRLSARCFDVIAHARVSRDLFWVDGARIPRRLPRDNPNRPLIRKIANRRRADGRAWRKRRVRRVVRKQLST